jgi:hypothetical protein
MYDHGSLSAKLRKPTKNLSQDNQYSVETRTQHLSNTSLRRYRYTSLLSELIVNNYIVMAFGISVKFSQFDSFIFTEVSSSPSPPGSSARELLKTYPSVQQKNNFPLLV